MAQKNSIPVKKDGSRGLTAIAFCKIYPPAANAQPWF